MSLTMNAILFVEHYASVRIDFYKRWTCISVITIFLIPAQLLNAPLIVKNNVGGPAVWGRVKLSMRTAEANGHRAREACLAVAENRDRVLFLNHFTHA